MRWSLKELYPSFDSEEFQSDLVIFKKLVKDINTWTSEAFSNVANSKQKLEIYIDYLKQYRYYVSRLAAFAHLTNAVDANDEDAFKYLDKIEVIANEITPSIVEFQNFLLKIDDLEEIISSSDVLKEHNYFIMSNKERAKYLLPKDQEVIISKLTNTGSSAWEGLQNKVVSTLEVDMTIDGKKETLPLPVVRNLAYDANPDLRKSAYFAELESYKKIEDASSAALNGIKGEVITLCDLRGYKSPLHETLIKSRMDEETLNAMLEAMNENLDIFHKYYKKKAELLGHKKSLPFYDLFAPVGKNDRTFSYEEAINYVIDNFRTFSDRLADFVKNAFENNWLDVEPRKGKRGGAFCSNLHCIGQSRVMANFNGSFSNMTTLAHELGHAYHGFNLKDESILNSSYPMPIAETASIFCETIVVNASLREAKTIDEKIAILEESISGSGQVIVDILSRFLFESEVFERRKDHPLTVNELNEIMIDSQKKAYGDSLDENYLHPYMWINKSHYYSANLSFYNFPYAFGLLFSKGLYAKYLNDKENFVKQYDALLRETGKNDIYHVAKMMDVDVHDKNFFTSSLKLIEQEINMYVELADEIIKGMA
ncbi:M3 family oligoendopeptidase [Soehngenia longivitae]|uniref:M3 family oligoendopeptidase n=1 Tax=Soehngenia longivitae TaxID=2562294 RepID=A0A4Z0D1I8_9FIRM|nr:M3 family oligoendopeptidase [Soehngenia longivitae]TFZ39185.1 M3 family oligoendopeptidase [Soehngenia longivitae]